MKKDILESINRDIKSRKSGWEEKDIYRDIHETTLSKYTALFLTMNNAILDGEEEEEEVIIARDYLSRVLNGEKIIALLLVMRPRFYVKNWREIHEEVKQNNVDSKDYINYLSKFSHLYKDGFSPRSGSSKSSEIGDLFNKADDTTTMENLRDENERLESKIRDLENKISTLQTERDQAREKCSLQDNALNEINGVLRDLPIS